jgi:hypothetical protein
MIEVCIFIGTKTDKYDILNIPDGFSYVAKIEKYLSINLEVLLLYIKIILKIILNVLLIVVVRVSRRGKAHMRFSVSRLKRIFTISYVNISMFFLST